MEEWKQRLREAREAKGLKKTAFALAVGVSNATVTDWEKSVDAGGIKEISGPKLTRVCEVLGVDPHWLLDGRPSDVEAALQLMPGARRVHASDDDDPSMTQIKKVKLHVRAGITGFQADPDYYDGETQGVPTAWMLQQGLSKSALVSTVVHGESMEPNLYDGDTIIVNTADKELVSGAVYVVNYEGEAIVKRMLRDAGQWWLTSDNVDQRKYHRQLCKGTDCIVIGKVIRKESTHI